MHQLTPTPLSITILLGPFFSIPPAPCGSVERLWFQLAQQFVRKGHKVTVVCRKWGNEPTVEVNGSLTIMRCCSFEAPKSLAVSVCKDALYSLQAAQKGRGADVVVTNSITLPLAASLCKARKTKLFVNVQRVPKAQYHLYKHLPIERFLAPSTHMRNLLIEKIPELEARSCVVGNPIDVEVFKPAPERKTPQETTILYSGRLHPEKGLELLINAFVELRRSVEQVKLKILGPHTITDGGGGEDYLRHLKQVSAGEPVEFLPAIYERTCYAKALQQATLYTYPSIAELGDASPVAPLEAMATGLVPVCSNLSVFRDYLEPNVSGLMFDHRVPEAPTRLAEQFEFLLNNPEEHQKMSANAIKRSQEFSIERIADAYLQVFAQ
ncbi:MAG: glycosyltransferase family 4 protein [Sumerlaeia bacterium]